MMCVVNSTPCVFWFSDFYYSHKRLSKISFDFILDIILAIRLMFTCHVCARVYGVNTGLR